MRVILEVLSGPLAGRKTRLAVGQELRVGRTEWADFAVPTDGHMSGIHFALETDERACYLQDLGSSNGTAVNGRPVAERIQLNDGDEILAGETRFRIRLEREEGDRVAAALTPGLERAGREPDRAAVAPPPQPRGKTSYTLERCESGLTLCRGSVAEIHPADLAALLAQKISLYLIVDSRKIEAPPPPPEPPCYLFDWLDPQAAALVSPVIVSQEDFADWPVVLQRGWGADAVICLFSKQAKEALVEHLRRSLRAKGKRDDPSAGMIGFCWPSVMALLLSHQTPRFVSQLLTGIDAVLVELPDLPETWQLFGGATMVEALDRLGLVRKAEGQPDA
jgi:FHA domain/Domain of unknown function (DUF4123)